MKNYLLLVIFSLALLNRFSLPTSSLFTDQETSNGNALAAGTLDLTVDDNQGSNVQNFTFNDLVPGDSKSNIFTLKNIGSVPGKPTICIKNVTNVESTGTTEFESDGNPGELGASLLVNSKINSFSLVDVDTSLDTLNNYCWSPSNAGDSEFASTGANIIDYNETATFELLFTLPLNVDNNIQGDSVNFDVEFNLEQQ
ncbi:hypothetical protein GW755_02145 [bacterium]|nr:hypothetical protein [bacterium]